jgi:hypothetical protein
MGLLERCHSYKDKISKGISANHALFAYPALMAAGYSPLRLQCRPSRRRPKTTPRSDPRFSRQD